MATRTIKGALPAVFVNKKTKISEPLAESTGMAIDNLTGYLHIIDTKARDRAEMVTRGLMIKYKSGYLLSDVTVRSAPKNTLDHITIKQGRALIKDREDLQLVLVPEPDNSYDHRAQQLWAETGPSNRVFLGYLARDVSFVIDCTSYTVAEVLSIEHKQRGGLRANIFLYDVEPQHVTAAREELLNEEW